MTHVAGKKSWVHGGEEGVSISERHIMSEVEGYLDNIGGYYDSYGGYHDSYRGDYQYIGDFELFSSLESSMTKEISSIY